jgi:predicted PurR-regulated permease PerM
MNQPNSDKTIILNFDRQFLSTVFKFLIFIVTIVLFILILPYSSIVLTPLIVSILLSFLVDPIIIFMQRNGFSRTAAVALIMAFFGMLFVLLIVWLAPIILVEIKSISQVLNHENPVEMLKKVEALLIRQIPVKLSPKVAEMLTSWLEDFFKSLINKSFNIIPNIFSSIIMIVLIPIMTFFFLKDGPRMKKNLIQIVPNRYFEMSLILTHKIGHQLGSYIRGQLIISLCIGALSMIALYILDVPYFFFIGVIAGMANMIPYFGPIAGAVPAVIVNFLDKGDFSAVIMVIIAFAVIRLIDDTVISPNILARSVEIHPLMVILVIFIGGEMFGLLGLLLCIPVTGIVKVTVKELIWSFKNYRLFD